MVKVKASASAGCTNELAESEYPGASAQVTRDSWFGPQEDRAKLLCFHFGGEMQAKERSCLACNDMPWDYSILFH